MARLTKIYTRTGDDGRTGLVGGRRVSKDSPRIWACGTVDELNSAIGLARSFNKSRKLDTMLARIQNDLFNLGAELATPSRQFIAGMPRVGRRDIAILEKLLDQLNAQLGPLREFILPAGAPVGAALHLARTICRRAERFCVRLNQREPLDECVIPYLNRLGDALFVLARSANRQQRVKETFWKK
jgi:cob(I)alamin adenosyltransferase